MFKAKKRGREKLFEQAMLSRKDRPVRRRVVSGERVALPWVPLSLWTAFSLVGGYILFFSPSLMIRTVTVEGESVIPRHEYQDFAESVLEGEYLGIFKKRNYFLVPTEEIANQILERYPLLSESVVKRDFPDGLTVLVREAPALLRWCSGGPCYGIRGGKAANIPYAEDDRYASSRLSVIDESALPVEIGNTLPVDPYLETFRSFRTGFGQLGAGEIVPIATTPSRHSNELSLSTSEGWRLSIAVNRPAEESLGTLQIFLAEYAKEHADRSRLISVDLRVEGKAFYIESGQSAEETEPVEAPSVSSEKETQRKKKKSD